MLEFLVIVTPLLKLNSFKSKISCIWLFFVSFWFGQVYMAETRVPDIVISTAAVT